MFPIPLLQFPSSKHSCPFLETVTIEAFGALIKLGNSFWVDLCCASTLHHSTNPRAFLIPLHPAHTNLCSSQISLRPLILLLPFLPPSNPRLSSSAVLLSPLHSLPPCLHPPVISGSSSLHLVDSESPLLFHPVTLPFFVCCSSISFPSRAILPPLTRSLFLALLPSFSLALPTLRHFPLLS